MWENDQHLTGRDNCIEGIVLAASSVCFYQRRKFLCSLLIYCCIIPIWIPPMCLHVNLIQYHFVYHPNQHVMELAQSSNDEKIPSLWCRPSAFEIEGREKRLTFFTYHRKHISRSHQQFLFNVFTLTQWQRTGLGLSLLSTNLSDVCHFMRYLSSAAR